MKTIRVAIVDDEQAPAYQLLSFLNHFAEKQGLKIETAMFDKPLAFLAAFHCDYDVLFLDIEMPSMNGIALAKKIREKDSSVFLIFVTNLAQYAIDGYSVSAFDYILKPVVENAFELKMSRLLKKLSADVEEKISIRTNRETLAVDVHDIDYIEPNNHHVIYHLVDKTVESYEAMKDVEKRLPSHFTKCNRYYLVNMARVSAVRGDSVYLGDTELKISRTEKKEFLRRFSEYLSVRGSR